MAGIGAISNSAPQSQLTNKMNNLEASDFVNLMITQLKNQDPTKPMTNQELLGQVTQIGTLQSQNALQESLGEMTLQNQITSAAGMIGKKVTGLAGDNSQIEGVVTSIKVVDKAVTLQLDDGSTLGLSRVTAVAPDEVATSAAQLGYANSATSNGLKSLLAA